MAFSADGKLLASGSSDKTIRLRDVQTHEQLAAIPRGSVVYGVAFSPDGTRLAAGCLDNTVRLIDVTRRQQVAELRGHTDYVHAVAWPDGTRLVSGSRDFTVRIWDSLSARERAKRAADKPTTRGKELGTRIRNLARQDRSGTETWQLRLGLQSGPSLNTVRLAYRSRPWLFDPL